MERGGARLITGKGGGGAHRERREVLLGGSGKLN